MQTIDITEELMFEDDAPESQLGIWLKRIVLIAVVLAILGGIGYGINSLMSGGAPAKKQVTTAISFHF